MAVITGSTRGDLLIGGVGDDTLFGLGGNDTLIDLVGNNTFDAGAGSDSVTAGFGNDVFIHRIAENVASCDRYDGGGGQDTLRLVLTSAEWARADVQADVAAFLAYQTKCLNVFLNPFGFSLPFVFKSTNLTVVNIEKLEVTVEGVALDPRNDVVVAVADTLAVTEDTSSNVNLLANDSVLDRAASVTLLSAGVYGTATLTPSLNGAVQTAMLSYTPNAAQQALRAGQVVTDTISYKVVDVNGDTSTATVTITITGANDAATIAGSATGGVTEDGTATATGVLTVSDVDTGENQAVAQTGVAGSYGSFSVTTAGAWTYSLNNSSASVQALAQGQAVTDSFTVKSKDGTASQVVTVVVTGSNDAPVFSSAAAAGSVTEQVTPNGNLTSTGSIGFTDIDLTDIHTVSAAPVGTTLGTLTATKTADTTGTGTGGSIGWSYGVAASAVEYLAAGQTKAETFSVTLNDGKGGVVTKQVVVTITGTNDAPIFAAAAATGAVTEQVTPNGNLTSTGTIGFTDVDLANMHIVSAACVGTTLGTLTATKTTDTTGTGTGGSIGWNYSVAAGAVEYLAAGQTKTESFTIKLNDGQGGIVTKQIDVTITGTNDAPIFATAAATGSVTEQITPNGNLTSSGTIGFTDVDLADIHIVSAASVGTTLGTLTATKTADTTNTGTGGSIGWSYSVADSAVEYLGAGETKAETFTVTLNDGKGGVVTKQVVVTITGTNDAAILSSATANLIEGDTAAAISTSGTLTASDVDSPATFVAQAATLGSYGSFSINAAGAWTYTASSAHNEFVAGTTYTDTFSVASADGTLTSVTVNILGTNDAAILSSATANLIEGDTAAAISTSGTLTASDVDSPATFVAQAATLGSYGSFSINAAGAWTYTASSAHNEFVAGTTYTDTFSVASADGTLTSVTVNILGTNDAAIITGLATGSVTEDGTLTAGGTLSVSDVDAGEAHFVAAAPGNLVGTYGNFTFNENTGAWTYALRNADANVQALTATDHPTDHLTVHSTDGTAQDISVVVNGANEGSSLGNLYAAAYINSNGIAGFQPNDATNPDVLIVGIYDTNNSNSLSVGDSIVWGRFPTSFSDLQGLGTFSVTGTQLVTGIYSQDANTLAVKASYSLYNDFLGQYVDVSWNMQLSHLGNYEDLFTNPNESLYDQFGSTFNPVMHLTDDANMSVNFFTGIAFNSDTIQAYDHGFPNPTPYTDITAGGTGGDDRFLNIDIGFSHFAVNHPPQAANGSFSGAEDTVLSGSVVITDQDATDVLSASVVNGPTHGSLTFNGATGAFTYTPFLDFNGSDFFTFKANDGQGDSNVATISFDVTPVNDPAIITGAVTGSVTEDGTLTAGGTLSVSDVDAGEAHFVAAAPADLAGAYGNFTFNENTGAWTYALRNADANVQALNATDHPTDHLTVHSADGTAQDIAVVVNGANEGSALGRLYAAAYINANGVNGFQPNDAVTPDVLIMGIYDTNNSNSLNVGDTVVWGNRPTSFSGPFTSLGGYAIPDVMGNVGAVTVSNSQQVMLRSTAGPDQFAVNLQIAPGSFELLQASPGPVLIVATSVRLFDNFTGADQNSSNSSASPYPAPPGTFQSPQTSPPGDDPFIDVDIGFSFFLGL